MFLLAIAVVVGWSAYSYWWEYSELAARRARESMAPAVGAKCTIILRTDELGIEKNRLYSVEIDGVSNHVAGEFVKLNDDWIVLKTTSTEETWIPRDHVLLLQVKP